MSWLDCDSGKNSGLWIPRWAVKSSLLHCTWTQRVTWYVRHRREDTRSFHRLENQSFGRHVKCRVHAEPHAGLPLRGLHTELPARGTTEALVKRRASPEQGSGLVQIPERRVLAPEEHFWDWATATNLKGSVGNKGTRTFWPLELSFNRTNRYAVV